MPRGSETAPMAPPPHRPAAPISADLLIPTNGGASSRTPVRELVAEHGCRSR